MILSFSACANNKNNGLSQSDKISLVENGISNEGNTDDGSTTASASGETDTKSSTSESTSTQKSTTTQGSTTTQEDVNSKGGTSQTTVTTVPEIEITVESTVSTDEEIVQPSVQNITSVVGTDTEHSLITASDYYQLNSLNSNKRELYLKIEETIGASENIVDVSRLSVSYDDVVSVFRKFYADHPQYFYVSRNCMLVYGYSGQKIRALILLYTDGTVTDEFDEKIQLVNAADRNVINEQVSALRSVTQNVVSKIPAGYSDVLKEKLIHDYVVETVEYDHAAAAAINENSSALTHAFDIYGAAIEGKAVCEGYAKWFQYLCYNVGINCTQTVGTASGGPHMWNAVLISGEWYQIDTTWNDASPIISYSYFNLTSESISEDHKIDDTELSVPLCNAVSYSFINVFAIYVSDIQCVPSDYASVINIAKTLEDTYLYIYFEDFETDRTGTINANKYSSYIYQYFSKKNSEVGAYLADLGMTLSTKVYTSNEYIVLAVGYGAK